MLVSENTTRAILSLAAEGLEARAISTELGVEPEVVKLTLSAHKAGTESDRDINDDELSLIRKKLVDLALYSGDEAIQARVGMFLVERDKPRKADTPPVSSIQQINIAIQTAAERFADLKKQYE